MTDPQQIQAWREWSRAAPPELLQAFERGELSDRPPRPEQIRIIFPRSVQLDLEVCPDANQLDLLED